MARAATVLIADDDRSMRQTMEAIVRNAGMFPITVASGEEALHTLQGSSVDVMLLDVQMPGMTGLEVLRQVREKHTDIGVIMISVVKEVPSRWRRCASAPSTTSPRTSRRPSSMPGS